MSRLFWLNDEQWAVIEPFMPKNQPGARPVIPGRSNRKRKITYDKSRYRDRHLVENAFCRLKDFWRIATRYDKLGRNFLSATAIASVVAFWI